MANLQSVPKKPSERRHRIKTLAPVKLPAASKRKVPPLPNSRTFTQATRDYWKLLWTSPMAVVYLDADVPGIYRLTVLHEKFVQGNANNRDLAEIRQLEDCYGLNPLARRRLQWEIDNAGGEESTPKASSGSEERWLRAVDSA